MPLSYCVHHTYLERNQRMIRTGPGGPIMMTTTRQNENETDTDCSGRSLATLVIAWMGAAMIASVLLRWTYMWIALTVLTLLFLLACAYATWNARRAHLRSLMREEARQAERQRRRERELETVSAGIDNYPEVIDPSTYERYWIADLPPAYTEVVGEQRSDRTNLPPIPDEPPGISNRRHSNPPPYSVAIQSESVALPSQSQTGPITDQNGHHSQSADQSGVVFQNTGRTVPPSGGQSGQHYSNVSRRTAAPSSLNIADEDKAEQNVVRDNPQPHNSTVLLTGTQYLTNIINSTFGRGQRRVNTENSGQVNASNAESSNNSQNNNGNNNNNNNNLNINNVDAQSTTGTVMDSRNDAPRNYFSNSSSRC